MKHTPGPWFADKKGSIWRRPYKDLYEYGGHVSGDKPIAMVMKGWYADYEQGYPVEANARLIAAAPDLLEALELARDHIDMAALEVSHCKDAERIRAAIAKATGEQQ